MRFAILIVPATLALFSTVGCQSLQSNSEPDKVAVEKAACLPANRTPGEGQRGTGDALYIPANCIGSAEVATTAMFDATVASDQLDQEVDVVDDATPLTDDVASNDYSACGKHVIALSTGAVGDPCMTTEAFIDSLSLTTSQKSAALASVNEARGLNSSTESSMSH